MDRQETKYINKLIIPSSHQWVDFSESSLCNFYDNKTCLSNMKYHLSGPPRRVILYTMECHQKSRLFMMFFLGGKPPHVKVYQAAIVSIIIGEVCRRGRN